MLQVICFIEMLPISLLGAYTGTYLTMKGIIHRDIRLVIGGHIVAAAPFIVTHLFIPSITALLFFSTLAIVVIVPIAVTIITIKSHL